MSKSCTNPHGLIFIKSWQISSSLLVVSRGMCEIIFAHFAQFLAIIVEGINGEGMSFLEQRYFNVQPGDFGKELFGKYAGQVRVS